MHVSAASAPSSHSLQHSAFSIQHFPMLPDLKLLIQLQELDRPPSACAGGSRTFRPHRPRSTRGWPNLTAAVAGVKERIAASQTARRDIEKDLAAVQARLSKYKDQLMEVKTNKEYHAMQTEITAAETAGPARGGSAARADGRSRDACRGAEGGRSGAQDGPGRTSTRERQQMEADRTATEQELEKTERRARAGRRRPCRRACSRSSSASRSTARAWRCPKRATGCAPSATSGCARRSTTSSAATRA